MTPKKDLPLKVGRKLQKYTKLDPENQLKMPTLVQ